MSRKISTPSAQGSTPKPQTKPKTAKPFPDNIDLTLSVRQPWASALVRGSKDVENRSRLTRHRGWLWIHASKALAGIVELDECAAIAGNRFRLPSAAEYGAIIGAVEIVGSVTESKSRWFFGPHGWVVGQRIAFTSPVPCSGMLGFWRPTPAVLAACSRELKRFT
jgi:ASCH domain